MQSVCALTHRKWRGRLAHVSNGREETQTVSECGARHTQYVAIVLDYMTLMQSKHASRRATRLGHADARVLL